MKKTNSNSIKRNLTTALSLVMTATMLASCGSGYGGSDSRKSSIYNNERTTAEDYRYNNVTAGDTDGTANIGGGYNTEEYNHLTENGYKLVSDEPLSTFSTDVDTASYTNVRRMINDGWEVDPDAVRTEEFINYFKYDYEKPTEGAVSINTELSDCPWNSEAKLMLVGLQAREAKVKDVPTNLVFLIDVSGSMEDEDKLPLVQKAFSMLAENLGADDRVSIVTYAGSDSVVLEGESGDNSDEIVSALNSLSAGGSTAGAAGITTAYKLAEEYFIEGGNNRVILATDGDLNVGLSSEEELTDLISQKRDSGVYLSVLGFGSGNYKDNRLEALADNGNGNYAYIDSVDEAKRVLVTEMSGMLFTVAKDAKVQIEFNPENVSAYRLVGYENRLLNDEDFEDDTKDAGDIGSDQQVTVLYEIVPNNGNEKSLKYQDNESEVAETSELSGEMLTVSVRYKDPEASESKLIDKSVMCSDYTEAVSQNFAKACSAAEFAMVLRNSDYASGLTAQGVVDYMEQNRVDNSELFELIYKYMQNGTGSEASYW